MAEIRLADIFQKPEFTRGVQERQINKNAFIQSGVMAPNADLMMACNGTSAAGEVTDIAPLATGEPDYGTDNPADIIVPAKLGTRQHKWRRATRAKAWSAMNLAQGMAFVDPMQGVMNQVGDYWTTDVQRRLINSAVGIYNLNASGAGDLIEDVSNDDAGAVTVDERASANNFLKALELKGDMDGIAAVGLHSTVYYGLRRLRHLVEQYDEVTDSTFFTFEGKRVIVDDSLPAVSGTNRVKFTSILFGAGAVASGEGNPPNIIPTEFDREAKAGNGTGQDTYITRRTDIIMPLGFSFNGAPGSGIAGQFATYAELQDAANWDQIWDSKNVPMSFLTTNG